MYKSGIILDGVLRDRIIVMTDFRIWRVIKSYTVLYELERKIF
jgi:hypothetical protein